MSLRGSLASARELFPARAGAGKYLERDYWAVIRACRYRPSELMRQVAERFVELAPADLTQFRCLDPGGGALAVGQELEVRIVGAGSCYVRVVHADAQSFTLATLKGHVEAGRITFGAYRSPHGDVIFHIRSRARSASRAKYLGFLAAGEAMQTNTWTDFVTAVAHSFGSGVIGFIHAETRPAPDDPNAENVLCAPTFHARGDDG